MSAPRAPSPDPKNTRDRLCLVVNPRAASGRAGSRLDALRALADGAFAEWDMRLTEGQGHARALAEEAAGPFDLVVAVGGDGTASEVAGGVSEAISRGANATLGVIPVGTGSDLVRSLLIPNDLAEAMTVAATGHTRALDCGSITLTDHQGQTRRRWFINVVGFGVNGEVVARVNRSGKRLGGRAAFLVATVAGALGYSPSRVVLRWEGPDGPGSWEGLLQAAFVANGAWCGAGMWVGRGGDMADGLLDLTVIPPMSILTSARHMPRLYDGTAHEAPGAFRQAISRLSAAPVDAESLIPMDVDGEQPGSLPMELQVHPGMLQVRGGWGSA